MDLTKTPVKACEGKALSELVNAPDHAIAGVSEADDKHLQEAFNIKTVGDLGKNKFFLRAQAIAALAEAEG